LRRAASHWQWPELVRYLSAVVHTRENKPARVLLSRAAVDCSQQQELTMTKRQAIAEVRAEANAIIEQLERRARGWDKGRWRDDMRDVECNAAGTHRRHDSLARGLRVLAGVLVPRPVGAPRHALASLRAHGEHPASGYMHPFPLFLCTSPLPVPLRRRRPFSRSWRAVLGALVSGFRFGCGGCSPFRSARLHYRDVVPAGPILSGA
jgi:hypothetical protein